MEPGLFAGGIALLLIVLVALIWYVLQMDAEARAVYLEYAMSVMRNGANAAVKVAAREATTKAATGVAAAAASFFAKRRHSQYNGS